MNILHVGWMETNSVNEIVYLYVLHRSVCDKLADFLYVQGPTGRSFGDLRETPQIRSFRQPVCVVSIESPTDGAVGVAGTDITGEHGTINVSSQQP